MPFYFAKSLLNFRETIIPEDKFSDIMPAQNN